MSIALLKEQLKEKKAGKLYLFIGPEQYLIRYYVKQIADLLLDKDSKIFNHSVFEGDLSINKLNDAISMLPLFSDRRVIIVRDSTLFKGEVKGQAWNALFESLPDYVCLIFIQPEVDKRTALYKSLKKHALIVECNRQNEATLAKWVIKVFSSYGKKISLADASYFVGLLDPDMTFILLEIEKVVRYADKENITRDDIIQVVSRSIRSRIFDLTDAVSRKQMEKAIKIVDELLQIKEPVHFIMAMISRQVGILLRMKKVEGKRLPPDRIAKTVGIQPFLIGKVQRQAASFTADELKALVRKCMETDLAIKTGKIDARMALELFILGMKPK